MANMNNLSRLYISICAKEFISHLTYFRFAPGPAIPHDEIGCEPFSRFIDMNQDVIYRKNDPYWAFTLQGIDEACARQWGLQYGK